MLICRPPIVAANGGRILSDDLSTSLINSPQNVEVLEFWAALRHRHRVAPMPAERQVADWNAGRVAMRWIGPGDIPSIKKDVQVLRRLNRDQAKAEHDPEEMVVGSPAMRWVMEQVEMLAGSETTTRPPPSGVVRPPPSRAARQSAAWLDDEQLIG